MNIKSIEQTINTIKSTYSPAKSQSPIKQQLILNYIQRVTEDLTNIINQNKEKRSALADRFSLFLTENWSLVKGSLLSYTALPTHEITLLLCSIAEEVAKIKNTSAIAILMPNINLDSLDPSKYPNLDELDIRQIIKTYVLNQDATFLIPISFLFKEEILQPNNIFNNFYYDVDKDEEEKINLKEEDLTILANHSSETKHIFYLKTQYQAFVNDQDTLLGQLNKLNQELLFNSKLGIGQEMHAGEGIYGAIINFNDYWSQLSIEIRKNLPSEVLNEINKLLKLASPDSSVNQNRNRNHQDIINTCLATRRSALENTIKKHHDQLININITENQKEICIQETIKEYEKSKNSIEYSVNKGKYYGEEKRGITKKIVHNLNVDLKFNDTLELIELLQGINAEEVDVILSLDQTPEKFLKVLKNVDDLVILSINVNNDVLRTILYKIKNIICQKLLNSSEKFKSFFISISVEQRAVIYELLKENFSTLIKNAGDLNNVLQFLDLDQCQNVLQNVKEKLPAIIQNADDLNNVLQFLDLDQCQLVLQSVKEKLPAIIQNADDLNNVLQFLDLDQCQLVLQSVKEKLPAIIKSADDLIIVVEFLGLGKCHSVLQSVKEKLPAIIKSADDLGKTLSYLDIDQCNIILDNVKKQLPILIRSPYNLNTVFSNLNKNKCQIVLNYLEKQLSIFIENDNDLKVSLYSLNLEQCQTILNHLEKKLHRLVENIDNLEKILPLGKQEFSYIRAELEKIELYKINDLIIDLMSSQISEWTLSDNSNIKNLLNSETKDSLLNKTLSNIKKFINHNDWDRQGVSFLSKKVPAGIQEMRKLLVSDLTDEKKLNQLYDIVYRKTNSSSWFRSERTKDFYTKLSNIFNDYSYLHQQNTEQSTISRLSR